jgi:hypothetical protein
MMPPRRKVKGEREKVKAQKKVSVAVLFALYFYSFTFPTHGYGETAIYTGKGVENEALFLYALFVADSVAQRDSRHHKTARRKPWMLIDPIGTWPLSPG